MLWELVEGARSAADDPAGQAEALIEVLVGQGPEPIVRFGEAFDAAVDDLYRWDLWGVAFLALGGCSDDAFEYLRCWLVGQGAATWERARLDPEGLFVDLLDGSPDPDARWDELGLVDGEPLRYVAGSAHERVTGAWLPPRAAPAPSEPVGDPWEEDDLPARFPVLAAALPAGWWDEDGAGDDGPVVMAIGPQGRPWDGPQGGLGEVVAAAADGLAAFAAGEHDRARTLLEPLVEVPDRWSLLGTLGGLDVDVAYAVAIDRLQGGDVEGAVAALRRVEAVADEADHVRRALAQVELARGELDAAARWIDPAPDAHRLDRALAATLAWRRGQVDDAVARAAALVAWAPGADDHPWDVAGAVLQAGLVLVEAGQLDGAIDAALAIGPLLADAPADLPLQAQLGILSAGAVRLQGRPDDAVALLDELLVDLTGGDRGLALRERGRALRAAGRKDASAALAEAAEAFDLAGERWEAAVTRVEAAG